jgi:lysyl-tRNA synthetase class II
MIEPEVAWHDSDDNMRLQEELVSYLVRRALDRCAAELALLERDTTALQRVVPPFPRLNYSDAVPLLQRKGSAIQWGEDLGAEDEALIVEEYDRPVFVFNYPKEAKAFYMKENPDDPRTVLCDDLLAPEGYGEIIGGSQREDDYDKLLHRIREEQLPEDAYHWYLDLRKYGTFVHAGFGLGLERMISWICGLPHLREAIAFPRMMHRLRPYGDETTLPRCAAGTGIAFSGEHGESLLERLLKLAGHRAGRPGAHGAVVHANDGQDVRCCSREEQLVRALQILREERPLRERDPRRVGQVDHHPPRHAGEDVV